MFCNRLASANDVISIVVGELFRTGLKAIRSISTPAIIAAIMLKAAQISHGNLRISEHEQSIAGDHHELTVCEVDQSQDAVDDNKPKCHQCVESAE